MLLLLFWKLICGKLVATSRADEKPSDEGRNPAPCGVRPSTQRAIPMFALTVEVGSSTFTKLMAPSKRLLGCPLEGPAGLEAPKNTGGSLKFTGFHANLPKMRMLSVMLWSMRVSMGIE